MTALWLISQIQPAAFSFALALSGLPKNHFELQRFLQFPDGTVKTIPFSVEHR